MTVRLLNSAHPGMAPGTYQIRDRGSYRVFVERVTHTLFVRDGEEPGVQEVQDIEHDFGETRETVLMLPCDERHIAEIAALVSRKNEAPTALTSGGEPGDHKQRRVEAGSANCTTLPAPSQPHPDSETAGDQ